MTHRPILNHFICKPIIIISALLQMLNNFINNLFVKLPPKPIKMFGYMDYHHNMFVQFLYQEVFSLTLYFHSSLIFFHVHYICLVLQQWHCPLLFIQFHPCIVSTYNASIRVQYFNSGQPRERKWWW